MAFPTSNQTLSAALDRVQGTASRIRAYCVNANNTMAAQDVSADFVINLLDNLKSAKEVFTEAAALTGMSDYAAAQLGKNVDSDFTAMVTTIDTAVSRIVAALPKDGSDRLIIETIDSNGDRAWVKFTPAQTSSVRDDLTGIIASIEA